MPSVFPFHAIQYTPAAGQLTDLIAPPYDVLDTSGKNKLLAKNPNNVVAIDLPHTPAKELGPPAAYEHAAELFRKHLASGVLAKSARPAIFAYRQTFASEGRTFERCGMFATVEVVPFGPRAGGGVLPHEETFSGPKEDRMALMKATGAQLSPIFGLHADEQGLATKLTREIMARSAPTRTAHLADPQQSVKQEVWEVIDAAIIKAYQDALAGEDIFIADGHHRYTTQLNYLKQLEAQGSVPASHPARRCMMVLIGMSDPGLVIWPTHRVLGGMKDYSWARFLTSAADHMKFEPVAGGLPAIGRTLDNVTHMGDHRFALYDFATGQGCLAIPQHPDPLLARFPEKPKAWRDLTVAFCQYVIVEQVCQARLNAGNAVKWAFPHTLAEVEDIGKGAETGAGGGAGFAQLAVIVRPTPLSAVRDVSRANQLMPQKSTFFYPKLATGMFVNVLE
jgi:uncharacterized protein (DUF1015 family)